MLGVLALSSGQVESPDAAFTLLAPEQTNVTVEFKLSLLSPARGDSLRAEAVVVKHGRTLTVCRSDVFASSTDGSQKLCATALATYMAIERS